MFDFVCPVCGEALKSEGNSLKCSNGHSYDRAKSGYVNLLMSQKSSDKRHGDDKLMVAARSGFLDEGHYAPLREKVASEVLKATYFGCRILDVGCGEGYYTEGVFAALSDNGITADFGGIDISKDALIAAGRRNKAFSLAVGSIFKLPVANEYADVIINIFAPHSAEEFARVLKTGGRYIRVIPLENHLMELKSVIYSNAYPNEVESRELSGFEILSENRLAYSFELNGNESIQRLYKMTPYYYKTSISDQKKLDNVEQLTVGAEFMVITYGKVKP